MERETFLKYLQKLEMAYAPKLSFTQELVDLWYEMFADCEEEGVRLAVNKCIKENEFAPNIAGLMKYYRELESEKNELRDVIQKQYTTMRSIWDEEYSSDTFKALTEYIMKFPKDRRKEEMVELTHRALSFAYGCEAAGRKEKPTIKEYVQGAR